MMTVGEAALALRDDPTFAAMTETEREAEAIELVGDDPLDVALAIEMALSAPAETPAIMGSGVEPCRLEADCGGREPLAGNGRCMTCGANRAAPCTPEQPVEAVPAAKAPTPRPAPVSSPVEAPARPGEPLVRRFKEALGMPDAQLAALIGVTRPTAQAYVSGRLAEQIDGVRSEYLLRALIKRQGQIAELIEELQARTLL